jgi:hypothetical protein
MKSFFSKNSNRKQKEETTILNDFQFNFLLSNTVYILPSTDNIVSNRIFIDFINFRKFINRSNFDQVVNHFIGLIIEILNKHETVELHLNLKSFSITAAEKYKDLVLLFYDKYQLNYINRINSVFVYNTPHVFEAIKTIFVKLSPLSNTFDFEPVLYSSAESPQKLSEVLKERMSSIYNNNENDSDEDKETTI